VAGGARGKNGAGAPRRANGDGGRAGRVPTISAPAFTGRREELAALGRALADPPAVVLVEGAAGIGKSRLVREFPYRANGQVHSPVAGCPPFRRPCTLARCSAVTLAGSPAARRARAARRGRYRDPDVPLCVLQGPPPHDVHGGQE